MTTTLTDLTEILRDERSDTKTRLLRLQGWRGQDLAKALEVGNAHRLAPMLCGFGALAVAATSSMLLTLVLLATAAIGVFASNHPVEMAYNALATRRGIGQIPPNRAAKRLGCATGTAFLTASAVSFALGYTVAGQVSAAVFGAVALFVAVTNVCVPSVIFTLLFGSEKGTAAKLIPLGRR